MIDYFEHILGPFPFDAYGTVMTAAPMSYALETQTRSLSSARQSSPMSRTGPRKASPMSWPISGSATA